MEQFIGFYKDKVVIVEAKTKEKAQTKFKNIIKKYKKECKQNG